MASLQLWKAAPISQSAADEATCLSMVVGLRIAPLEMGGRLGSMPRKKWPPVRLRAMVSLSGTEDS